MNAFRKLSWLFDLAGLTVLAMVLAFGVNDLLATMLLSTGAKDPPAMVAEVGADTLTRADVDVASALTERRPLNTDEEGPLFVASSPPTPAPRPCIGPECGGPAPEPKVERTRLMVSLVGTLVSPSDPNIRFANVLLKGNETRLVTVGSVVADGVTVADVRQRVIYLREGGDITFVPLWNGTPAAPARPKAPTVSRRARPEPRARRPRPTGVSRRRAAPINARKLGDNHWALDRSEVRSTLDNPRSGQGMRAVPNYRKGRMEGYRLASVKAGSLGRSLGLRSGDVIRSVNGRTINSPNVMMELYQSLQSASQLELEVERRGQLQAMKYTIQ